MVMVWNINFRGNGMGNRCKSCNGNDNGNGNGNGFSSVYDIHGHDNS